MPCVATLVLADHHLREEEAVVVARLDACERHIRGDAGDADPVDRGGDRAGGVRAVADVVVALNNGIGSPLDDRRCWRRRSSA